MVLPPPNPITVKVGSGPVKEVDNPYTLRVEVELERKNFSVVST